MHHLCLIFLIWICRCAVAPPPPLTAEDVLGALIVTKYDTNNDGSLSAPEFIEISEEYDTRKGLARAKFGKEFVFPDKSYVVTLFQEILQEFDTDSTGKLTSEALATFLKSTENTERRKRFAAWIIYLADSSESGSNDIGFIDQSEKFWLDNHFGLGYTEKESATAFQELQQALVGNGYNIVVNEKIWCEGLVELIAEVDLYYWIFPLKSDLTSENDKTQTGETYDYSADDEDDDDDDDGDDYDDDDDWWWFL